MKMSEAMMSSMLVAAFLPSSVYAWGPAPPAPIDKQWKKYLETPPPSAVSLAANLTSRADAIAQDLQNRHLHGEFDMVTSGGGDLNAYSLGIEMILNRTGLRPVRRGGVSGGGWMSFELALKGEQTTLQKTTCRMAL